MKPAVVNHLFYTLKELILFLLVISFSMCNSEAVETSTDAAATTDAMAATTVTPASTDAIPRTTGENLDTAITKSTDLLPSSTDAAPSTLTNQPSVRKSATLGYSYPTRMYRGETKSINVYVAIKNQESRVRDTLKMIVDEQSGNDDDSVAIKIIANVIWYKALKIELRDPAGDFTIDRVHDNDEQIIDTVEGNRWRWTITTTTDKKTTQLILKVEAAKEDGTKDRFNDRTIHIPIQIDRNIVRRFFNYLTDNPAVSVPILVSLFGFLGWFIKRRYDKGKGAS